MSDESYTGLSDVCQAAVLNVKNAIESEERLFRPSMLRMYKEMELYWEGLQDSFFWNSQLADYVAVAGQRDAAGNLVQDDPVRNINIVRAHGESITAALTASLPQNRYNPEDPDDPDDIRTSKAYDTIEELLVIRNEMPLKLVKAMFILLNQGLLFAYNYTRRDKSYGVLKKPVFELGEETRNVELCPQCGAEVTDSFQDFPDDIVTGEPAGNKQFCPECAASDGQPQPLQGPPVPKAITEPKLILSKYEDQERGREIIEFWGPLNVHYPINVGSPKDAGYLILSKELNYSLVRSIYPERSQDIQPGVNREPYEQWARMDPKLPQDRNYNSVTVDAIWLRPSMYYYNCVSEEARKELLANYPEGIYCVFVQDKYMEAHAESVDDHWTVTENPLSRSLHASPILRPLLDMQDLFTEAVNITAQTMEYGIPQTFADPKVLDFEAYGQRRQKVGEVFPIKLGAGTQGADKFFHTEKAAVMSQEIEPFQRLLIEMAQFVSGDVPSIFGGAAQGGSKTLGEYEASRSMALQRLSLSWKMITAWYANLMGKAVKAYADTLREDGVDDFFVAKKGNTFLKSWIYVSDLTGKVGEVLPESSEEFPTSWSQRVARVFQILQTNNQFLIGMIFTPENISFIKRIIGVEDLNVPGDEQRDKQLEIIFELMKSEPVPGQQMMGPLGPMAGPDGQPMMGPPQPSIQPEALIDDPTIAISTCREFLVSQIGRALKIGNPPGYQNIELYLQAFLTLQQQQQMQQQQAQMQQQSQEESADAGHANANQ